MENKSNEDGLLKGIKKGKKKKTNEEKENKI
jgi:hypothetical protein